MTTSPITMDIEEILKYLPHRYPFLLIDRVLEIEHGKSIVGQKNTPANTGGSFSGLQTVFIEPSDSQFFEDIRHRPFLGLCSFLQTMLRVFLYGDRDRMLL